VVAGLDDEAGAMSDPAPPANAGPPPQQALPPSSATLMSAVVALLGLALILLVVFDGIAVLQGKSSNDLNTLTSLIAGGFVGFLTPHVAGTISVRRQAGPKG
jgi:hypothetical protein